MFLFDTSRVIVKLIIGIFLCFNISAFANQCNTNSSIADVVEKLSPAIVNISTTQLVENGNKNLPFSEMPEEFFKFFEEFNKNSDSNKPSKIVSLGSGFLIDDKGHIVTNNHVIENAQEINITIGDNEKKIYKAKVKKFIQKKIF